LAAVVAKKIEHYVSCFEMKDFFLFSLIIILILNTSVLHIINEEMLAVLNVSNLDDIELSRSHFTSH